MRASRRTCRRRGAAPRAAENLRRPAGPTGMRRTAGAPPTADARSRHRSMGKARRLARRARHVAEPGNEHVANIHLAGRVLAAAATVLVSDVAEIAAADLDPFGAFTQQAETDAIV